MRLHTRHTYSLEAARNVPLYPALDRDRETDVLVIGTGISGALVGWTLQKAGVRCLLIDRRDAATGSTAASTSLLQYDLDTPLTRLTESFGAARAGRAYSLCHDAIGRLRSICSRLDSGPYFAHRPSLQFASTEAAAEALHKECAARAALGLDVQMLDSAALKAYCGIEKPAALLSATGAEVDAFELTHALLADVVKMGGAVYGHTEAATIDRGSDSVTVTSAAGVRIRARHLVIACGYESQRYLPLPVEQLFSTYAVASKPFHPQHLWSDRALIWETARPYTYLRTTPDNRVIIGGKDTEFDGRSDFPLCAQKARALEFAFRTLFPGIPFETDFSWAGVFGESPDGLPYIGPFEGHPNTWYTLGYGGNGILFSVLAADILSALILNGQHPDSHLFSFSRT